MTTLSVNGLRAVSVRLWHPWQGSWIAEVDFDLAIVPVVPSGPVVLKIGNAVLRGTVDPNASGKFGEKAKARIIAGAGGWHRNVSAQHFKNDAGVTTTAVISATAAEIGETAIVAIPSLLGSDYERTAGPAARVLAGLDWYTTLEGVTTIGPRITIPVTPEVDVLEWDPHQQRAELAADTIVTPGTLLVDPRFGTATVRDVEQVFSEGKARATVWCGEAAASRVSTMLGALVRSYGHTDNLRTYHYRVVAQGVDGRLTLQAVIDPGKTKTAGQPDSIAVPVWLGVPGVTAKVVPGTEASVIFLDGDPAKPVVTAFKEADVIQLTIGNGASPVALATLVQAQLNTLKAAIAAAPIVALDGGASFKAALVAALASWPGPVASTKLLSD